VGNEQELTLMDETEANTGVKRRRGRRVKEGEGRMKKALVWVEVVL